MDTCMQTDMLSCLHCHRNSMNILHTKSALSKNIQRGMEHVSYVNYIFLLLCLCILMVMFIYFVNYIFLLLCLCILMVVYIFFKLRIFIMFMYSYGYAYIFCKIMYFYCHIYVFLWLCLYIFVNYVFYCYVYIFLLLCMFSSVYSVSLCCSVYCWCVNVYCTAATGWLPNCSWQIGNKFKHIFLQACPSSTPLIKVTLRSAYISELIDWTLFRT
jgi:hypothetical protein